MNNYEASVKDSSGQHMTLSHDPVHRRSIPTVSVVCDQGDTAPVWGYILRQRGMNVVLETSLEKAIDGLSTEVPDLVIIDIDLTRRDIPGLCQKFREVSVTPILLFLPTHHETQILEAYAAGVDEVVVKPISPAIFQAKVTAWLRRSWMVPVDTVSLVKAGKHRLDPARRCLIHPDGREIKFTNLEFRLMLLLMSRPGHVFSVDDIVHSMWGGYDNGDHVLLKNVVYRLRRKIEVDPHHPLLLQTEPGGYSFQG